MIIIIDNYDSFTYNLYQAMAMITPIKIFRNDQITVKAIADLNPLGIIISPGPGRPEQAGICIELISKLISSIPILGVCLGHQAIAMALGGVVKLAPEPIHGKPANIFHNGDQLYQHLPKPFQAGRYHSLIVERETLPQALTIASETEDGLIMGIHHQYYPTFGVQFHPESILTPLGNQLLQNFVKCCELFQQKQKECISC